MLQQNIEGSDASASQHAADSTDWLAINYVGAEFSTASVASLDLRLPHSEQWEELLSVYE
jgi:hypothetical protein